MVTSVDVTHGDHGTAGHGPVDSGHTGTRGCARCVRTREGSTWVAAPPEIIAGAEPARARGGTADGGLDGFDGRR